MEEGESSSGDPRSPLWKKLWNLNIPPKVRIFAWKMCMNALCEICPACGKEPESILYVLVKCEVAKRVWRCWVDGPVDLLNVNMDVIDIAMQIFDFGTS